VEEKESEVRETQNEKSKERWNEDDNEKRWKERLKGEERRRKGKEMQSEVEGEEAF